MNHTLARVLAPLRASLFALLATGPITACCATAPQPAAEEPPPPAPIPPPTVTANELATRYDEYPGGSPRPIFISDAIAGPCGMDTSRTYFEFGSAQTDVLDEVVAAQVGGCMTTGPLAGKSVVIIGFADERGPADYNLELGMKRAVSIAESLSKNGVAKDRIYVASYGEIPRERASEADFARDRRATIRVLK